MNQPAASGFVNCAFTYVYVLASAISRSIATPLPPPTFFVIPFADFGHLGTLHYFELAHAVG